VNHLLWKKRIQFCLEGKENIEKTAAGYAGQLQGRYVAVRYRGYSQINFIIVKPVNSMN